MLRSNLQRRRLGYNRSGIWGLDGLRLLTFAGAFMELSANNREIRQLLSDMLAIVDSSSDAIASRYAELRDGSYELAVQVRTAAIPNPEARQKAFILETTGRKW